MGVSALTSFFYGKLAIRQDCVMIEVVLVGIGGYGGNYVSEMLQHSQARGARLAGCVDPFAASCSKIDELRKLNVPIYDDLGEFYKNHTADLAVISSPIHYHKTQSVAALQAGSNVLCEKPVAALVEEGEEMAAAAKQAGRFLAIGYQLSFSPVILSLKEDILAGRYGRPLRFKTMTCWPRPESYYNRNNWAGRIKSPRGQWVLDSPANNATAHYLHNMLFLAGGAIDKSASPREVRAELFRAKKYENYDTAAMRIFVEGGVEILFLTTHSCKELIGPIMGLEFENGKVTFDNVNRQLTGLSSAGEKNYGNPLEDSLYKLWVCIDAVKNGGPISCDIETAMPHLHCINIAQKSPILDVSKEKIKTAVRDGDAITYVEGMEEAFKKCFNAWALPSECGCSVFF